MRLNARMSQDEIRSTLYRSAQESWGPERLDELGGALNKTAKAIWTVLQCPLTPLSEEPDLSVPWYRTREEV